MSEELKNLSAFEAFQQSMMTFAEAEEKEKLEAGAPKIERFRTGEDGEYSIRVLPLAPNFDKNGNVLPMERRGYEYPLHQIFLTIEAPTKKGKNKKLNIPVIRTTDKEVGYSVDLIDTYVKIAKEMYGDDEKLIEHLTGSAFNGGMRYNFQHAMLVLDLSNDKSRAKGPQIYQCSHSIYKNIDAAKMRLWRDLYEEDGQDTCPISGFTNAYPIKIIRKTDKKTEYTVEIGRKTADLKEEELMKLIDLPRIPELIYRYTRYHMEATLVFLKQYDKKHDMEVCKEPDFLEAVEKLKGELPKDDTSHFDLSEAAEKDTAKDEVTIDSLWAEYDAITDEGLTEKSDEYQDLRERIRQFIEDKGLDVRISRSKNNQQLLNEIDEALESGQNLKQDEPEETSASRRSERPKAEPEKDDVEEAEIIEETESEEKDVPAPENPRMRRPRPIANMGVEDEPNEAPVLEEAPAESPRRRRRLR